MSEVQEWRPLIEAPRGRVPRGPPLLRALRRTCGLGASPGCSTLMQAVSHCVVTPQGWLPSHAGPHGSFEAPGKGLLRFTSFLDPFPLPPNSQIFFLLRRAWPFIVSRASLSVHLLYLHPRATCSFTTTQHHVPALLSLCTHIAENSVLPLSSNLHGSHISSSRPKFAI